MLNYDITLIICFHSQRVQNLLQMLRFIDEPINCEYIFVCQDTIPEGFDLPGKQVSLNLDTYCRAKMLNIGVLLASSDIIALLDCDRILPSNYFYKQIKGWVAKKVIAPIKLYKLQQPYSDFEIKNELFRALPDFRSSDNQPRKKNLFAGNTIMSKNDYLEMGGADERYTGYGFMDNDLVNRALKIGLQPQFNNEIELHLHHEGLIEWDKKIIGRQLWKVIAAKNAIRYKRTWKENHPSISNLIAEVKRDINLFDPSMRNEFFAELGIKLS